MPETVRETEEGKRPPGRRGIAKNYSFDPDAVALLRELCPSRKSHGKFLSELIRREQALREERARLRAERPGVSS